MINTVNTKQQQIQNGFFKTGTGDTKILIVGSCRCVPYLNYFNRLNSKDIYTVYFIDPFNWNFDANDNRVDYEAVINSLETNEAMLNMLASIDIYIHEYYSQFGMFNSSKEAVKNIYQFGLNPKHDICIPNYNDVFVLFNDLLTFDQEVIKIAIQDVNVLGKLSEQTESVIVAKSNTNLKRFYSVCRKSDFPEMEEYFKSTWKNTRMFWTYNHISSAFSLYIFEGLCRRLEILPYQSEWFEIRNLPDLFENPHTGITEYDKKHFGLNYNEKLVPLKV